MEGLLYTLINKETPLCNFIIRLINKGEQFNENRASVNKKEPINLFEIMNREKIERMQE